MLFQSTADLRAGGELNAADWRPCTGNHEQQQRVWQLSAGPHTGVSPAGLCAQQDGEDCGAGGEQRRENRYAWMNGGIIDPGHRKMGKSQIST